MYILPGSWGSGLGHELLQEAIGQMKKSSVEKCFLWAFKENRRAGKFYEKHVRPIK